MCLSNDEYAASLEPRKIYVALRDSETERNGLLRLIDESSDNYLRSIAICDVETAAQSGASPNRGQLKHPVPLCGVTRSGRFAPSHVNCVSTHLIRTFRAAYPSIKRTALSLKYPCGQLVGLLPMSCTPAIHVSGSYPGWTTLSALRTGPMRGWCGRGEEGLESRSSEKYRSPASVPECVP